MRATVVLLCLLSQLPASQSRATHPHPLRDEEPFGRGRGAASAAATVSPPPAPGSSCPSYAFLSPVPLPSDAPLPSAIASALAQMNASLTASLDPVFLPGFAVSVHYAGAQLGSWGGGEAVRGASGAPDPLASVFRIASNTKLFVCLLAVLFRDLGYLSSLDAAVSSYVPDFAPLNPFDASAITFRQLMSHASGLPDELPGLVDWGTNITTAGVLAILRGTPLAYAPGSFPHYSNLGIALLGHVLAEFVAPPAQRGGGVGGLIETFITGPLGMDKTVYLPTLEGLTPGYDGEGQPVPLQSLGWDAPCGSMASTPFELNVFLQAIAAAAAGEATPLGLAPASAREFLQPTYALPDLSLLIGTPFEMMVIPDTAGAPGGFIARTKSGTLSGYATKSALIPELRLSVAFQFNGNFAQWYDGDALIRRLLGLLAPAVTQAIAAVQLPPPLGPAPRNYTGTFTQDIDPSTSLVIAAVNNGTLLEATMTSPGSPPQVGWLAWVLEDAFRWYTPPSASDCEHLFLGDTPYGVLLMFQRDADGVVAQVLVAGSTGTWSLATPGRADGGGTQNVAAESER